MVELKRAAGHNGLVSAVEQRAVDVVLEGVIIELDAGVVGDRVAEIELVSDGGIDGVGIAARAG